jgi:hypothetical protein
MSRVSVIGIGIFIRFLNQRPGTLSFEMQYPNEKRADCQPASSRSRLTNKS